MRVRTEGANVRSKDNLGKYFQYINNVRVDSPPTTSAQYYKSYKICQDEVHPRHPMEGGPFSLDSVRTEFSDDSVPLAGACFQHPITRRWYTPNGLAYSGSVRAEQSSYVGIGTSKTAYTESLGADAWNRMIPTQPKVGLAQTIVELRDIRQLGLTRIRDLKRAVDYARSAGSNYLAYEFGWKPLLSDLTSLLSSIRDIDRQIAQLRKQNGRYQRRGGTLFDTCTVSETTDQLGVNPIGYFVVSSNAISKITVNERAWFKGVMRYYIPQLEDPKWGKFRAVQELWDLKITPQLVYQLTPWSWMLDWFTNVGSLVGNLQAQISNQVAAKYAYVMYSRSEVRLRSVTASYWYIDVYGGSRAYRTATPSSTMTLESKNRSEASPFGFAFDMSALSDWQLSILTALGLSRLK